MTLNPKPLDPETLDPNDFNFYRVFKSAAFKTGGHGQRAQRSLRRLEGVLVLFGLGFRVQGLGCQNLGV